MASKSLKGIRAAPCNRAADTSNQSEDPDALPLENYPLRLLAVNLDDAVSRTLAEVLPPECSLMNCPTPRDAAARLKNESVDVVIIDPNRREFVEPFEIRVAAPGVPVILMGKPGRGAPRERIAGHSPAVIVEESHSIGALALAIIDSAAHHRAHHGIPPVTEVLTCVAFLTRRFPEEWPAQQRLAVSTLITFLDSPHIAPPVFAGSAKYCRDLLYSPPGRRVRTLANTASQIRAQLQKFSGRAYLTGAAVDVVRELSINRRTTRADLALLTGLSPWQLSRLVSTATDCHLADLRHACALQGHVARVCVANDLLKLIAFESGFVAQCQFNRAFHRLFRMPPSALRTAIVQSLQARQRRLAPDSRVGEAPVVRTNSQANPIDDNE